MHTVIGAFDDRASAQRTVDQLRLRGFERESINLQTRPDAPDPAATTATSTTAATSPTTGAATSIDRDVDRRRDPDDGFLAGVRHLLASLFGADEERQVGLYSEAIRRGSTLVIVDARDQDEADRAAGVMREQGGTIDLEKRSTAWRAEGWGAEAHAATGGTAGASASAETLTDAERLRISGPAKGQLVMPAVLEARRTDVEIDRLSRQADDALGRATGDAHDDDDDALARMPDVTPPIVERGRAPERSETRRKT